MGKVLIMTSPDHKTEIVAGAGPDVFAYWKSKEYKAKKEQTRLERFK